MKVKLARTAGFCMGVRRAVEMVLEEANRLEGRLVTYGPLIHNTQVLDLLADKGIVAITDTAELTGVETAVIRAHGVPPEKKTELKKTAGRVLDATCPRVVKVQMIIRRYTAQGCQAIILGDEDHAEVKGLWGHARGRGVVIGDVADVAALPDYDRVLLVAQTTQSEALFDQVAEAVRARWPEAQIHNTICHATHERQAEVLSLAKSQEGVVVVGGAFSANTQRLVSLAEQAGAEVFAVETEADLDLDAISRLKSVGVTAGASTPTWLIRKVVEELRGRRGRGESRLKALSFRAYRFLLKSATLVALGGAGLAAVAGLNLTADFDWRLLGVPFFYLYAMHILNHFVDRQATVYNDPDRAKFLDKHQVYLVTTACLAAALGLIASAGLGWEPFLILLALLVLGLAYSIRLVPARWERAVPYVKLKDFPGSKPLSIALAWGAAGGLWPAVAFGGTGLDAGFGFVAVAALAFIRSAFFDITDVQGDLVVGKETLAILLGERRTLALLRTMALVTAAAAAVGAAIGVYHPSGWIFSASAIGLWILQSAYQKKRLLPGAFLEGLVEANFLIAGALAGLWWVFGRIG